MIGNEERSMLADAFFVATAPAGFLIATFVRVRAIRRGDGLLQEWWKGGLAFVLTVGGLVLVGDWWAI
jgi:hypothetical protein